VHDPEYVDAVHKGNPRELAESQGFHWDPGALGNGMCLEWRGHGCRHRGTPHPQRFWIALKRASPRAASPEAFAAIHRRVVWDDVLAPERKRRRQPDWQPSSFMEGLVFQSRVNKILHEQFKVAGVTKAKKEHSVISLPLVEAFCIRPDGSKK
jgi:hypothetical protein